MSEEIETPVPVAPAFVEYDVPGIGTVIDPQGEPGYRVRLPDGQVTAYPAASGDPCETNAAADLAHALAHPPAEPVPQSVTRRQLLLVLNASGVTRAAIRAQLAGNEAALIEFDEASSFDRSHPLVAQLGASLGMGAEQIDDMFRAAASL
jgi:hypothetical protein